MPLLPGDRARAGGETLPALPAVIPRCRRPSAARAPHVPSEMQTKGSPAARANHARRPVRDPSGAETGATRMGRSIIERTEPIGSVRRLVLDLPDPIPVTEGELRAIEILLGNSLKDLLASTSKASLKHRSGR